MVLMILALLAVSAYTALMIAYRRGWDRTPAFNLPEHVQPQTRVAVIVPARNEEAVVENCLKSLQLQDYPAHLLQIILVDDHSEDATATIGRQLGVTVIRMQDFPFPEGQAFKKYALQKGIEQASEATLILTTDADCTMGPLWVKTMAAFYERTGAKAIVSPVRFTTTADLLDIFQTLDFAGMQGITAAVNTLRWGTMANGANLAFARTAFDAVGGYSGTTHLATGDDYLLVHKLQGAFPGGVQYLKAREAMVYTAPQPDLLSFFQQRIRWASKSGKYKDPLLTAQLGLVYIVNLLLLISLIAVFTPAMSLGLLLVLWAVKAGAEYYFLEPVLRYYRLSHLSIQFLLLQPLHVGYIVLAGFLGFWGKYEWKSREIG
ncbi:MAG: glycosyltransferase [Sphingobacteriales bacterium]|nr:MAG: glycosyltransferase [Sphingobacteriales bacterium]